MEGPWKENEVSGSKFYEKEAGGSRSLEKEARISRSQKKGSGGLRQSAPSSCLPFRAGPNPSLTECLT